MSENLSETEEKRNCNRIVDHCDKLIQNTEAELFKYKNDKIKLKEEVFKILQENQIVHSELRNLKKSNSNNNEDTEIHSKLTNEAIHKLKGQIQCLKEERDTIHTLWKSSKDTIKNLETEICNYRDQIFNPNAINEIKSRYSVTINFLEKNVKNLRIELDKQVTLNKELLKNNAMTDSKLKSYEGKIEEFKQYDNNILKMKNKLENVMRTNSELEKSLKLAKRILDERFFREKETLDKIQEALQIAELAIAEKDEVLTREEVIREECDHLATTIGQVMEEAANKVESNIDKLNGKHNREIEKFRKENIQTLKKLDNQKKISNVAEARCQALEKKIKDLVQENISLDADLQVASQAIVELELKLQAFEGLMISDKETNKMSQERENEINRYLLNNQQLKERWKSAVEDVTKRFEKEISFLNNENTIIKAQNQELNLKLMQYEYK